jgi:hypothetical protein
MKIFIRNFFYFSFLIPFCGQAAELPSSLSEIEIKSISSNLGFSALHRSWTAHALPSSSLGLDVGLEAGFAWRRDTLALGDGQGVVPRIVPVPKLWIAWDLPHELTLSLSASFGFLFDGISSYGGALQWYIFEIPELFSSLSLVSSFTYVDIFQDLNGKMMGLALQLSRDMRSWQPYLAAGVVNGYFYAKDRLLSDGVKIGPHQQVKSHFYGGIRGDNVSKLSLQLDLIGSKLAAAILLAQTF